ncbi:hypothetical protein BGY98DRAFT_983807 [Russula aff. rugulosa BPL654]|nr:hypothetical protein BGY98DRAFT_983807 [Russula aff. rugulosa BPL654]
MPSLTLLRRVNQGHDKINGVQTSLEPILRGYRDAAQDSSLDGPTGETITGTGRRVCGERTGFRMYSMDPSLGSFSDSGRLSARRQDRISVAAARSSPIICTCRCQQGTRELKNFNLRWRLIVTSRTVSPASTGHWSGRSEARILCLGEGLIDVLEARSRYSNRKTNGDFELDRESDVCEGRIGILDGFGPAISHSVMSRGMLRHHCIIPDTFIKTIHMLSGRCHIGSCRI